jgi:hypothetical protein
MPMQSAVNSWIGLGKSEPRPQAPQHPLESSYCTGVPLGEKRARCRSTCIHGRPGRSGRLPGKDPLVSSELRKGTPEFGKLTRDTTLYRQSVWLHPPPGRSGRRVVPRACAVTPADPDACRARTPPCIVKPYGYTPLGEEVGAGSVYIDSAWAVCAPQAADSRLLTPAIRVNAHAVLPPLQTRMVAGPPCIVKSKQGVRTACPRTVRETESSKHGCLFDLSCRRMLHFAVRSI